MSLSDDPSVCTGIVLSMWVAPRVFRLSRGITIDDARSVFIRPDGTILVGGYDYTTGTNGQIALAELLDKNKVIVL